MTSTIKIKKLKYENSYLEYKQPTYICSSCKESWVKKEDAIEVMSLVVNWLDSFN
jgi:transposase